MPPNDVLGALGVTPDEQGQLAPPAPAAQPSAVGLDINNPLNLRPMAQGAWPGQSGVSGGFASFDSLEHGWDAAEQNLLAKVSKHGAKSLNDIIGNPNYGWAPAADNNNPAQYAGTVAGGLGVKPDDDISQRILTDPAFRHNVLQGMAGVEMGKPMTYGGGAADPLAALGVTPQEKAALAAQTPPAPTTAAGKTPGTNANLLAGGEHMTAAQEKFFTTNNPSRHFNDTDPEGSATNPMYQTPGGAIPQTPGAHWVDADGTEHIVAGGLAEKAAGAGAGLLQGLGADTAASASRLTGGGIGVPSAEGGMGGMGTALAQTFGNQDVGAQAKATQAAVAQQQRDYQIQHGSNAFAQGGRFVGQMVPSTAAALAVPELEAPEVAGSAFANTALRGGAKVATNALRGTAASAANVGANPNVPIGTQLAAGALTGAVAPLVVDAPVAAAKAVTGLGRTVAPEVASLADAAQTKYGIPLRAGQVMGANGDRAAATADSNLLGSSEKVRANNNAQRQAFMKGVTGTYGDASGDVSPQALSAAKANVVAPMNDVASRTSILADPVQTRVSQIIGDAQKVLPDNEVTPLLKLAENIGSVRQGDRISGEAYQALTRTGAPLDRLIQSDNPNVSHYASQVRDALDDGLQASAAPEDVAALQKARFQYKNLMTVAKLAPKAGVDGVISPALLRGAVTTNFKNAAFQGAGDLGELAQIGQTFMKEPPNSFTSNRAADMLGPIKSGLEAAGATDIALTLLHRPEAAVGAGASALAGYGVKSAAQALKMNRVASPATNIVQRSLPGTPGTNAFSGLKSVGQKIEVPLSALAGLRGLNALTPAGANAQ